MEKEIDCRHCKHYFVTWDTSAPQGCRIFNMKSKKKPCLIVKETSGQECKKFEAKKNKTKGSWADDLW